MKNKLNKLFLVSALVLTSCQNYFVDPSVVMNAWMGKSLDDAIAAWGYPDEEKTIAGRKLFVWKSEEVISEQGVSNTSGYIPTDREGRLIGGSIQTTTYSTPGYTRTVTCQRILEVNGKHKSIIGWDLKGDGCDGYFSRYNVMPQPQTIQPILNQNFQ